MRWSVILTLLLVVHSTFGQTAAITIAQESRVANTDKNGVCWFCCAATIGKHAGIIPLQDLDQRVLKSGIGHQGGASEESIAHWMQELKLKPLVNPVGKKDREGVERLQGWLDRQLPVIVSYTHATGGHAILLTRISRAKEKWTTAEGQEIHDYAINYVDPDDPKHTWKVSWSWFHQVWTGRAYAFDPKEQLPQLIQVPELRPGRLMMATGGFVPIRKTLSPELLERTKHIAPPIEARYEAKPYLPHQVPYEAKYPAFNEKIKIPSNQDLNDGVVRPWDFFANNCYGYFDYNYHSEYEAFKAKKQP